MMLTRTVTCDYCTATLDLEESDLDPTEMGWLSVSRYDMIREEVRHYDFCSDECLVAHFG